jgi:hypothetical protein
MLPELCQPTRVYVPLKWRPNRRAAARTKSARTAVHAMHRTAHVTARFRVQPDVRLDIETALMEIRGENGRIQEQVMLRMASSFAIRLRAVVAMIVDMTQSSSLETMSP